MYRWIGASKTGCGSWNFIENGQQKEGTVQLDFTKAVPEVPKWLRALDLLPIKKTKPNGRTALPGLKDSVTTKSGKRVLQKRKIVDKTAMPYVKMPVKIIGKLLTSIKQVNYSISETGNTRLPGYTDSTQFFGQELQKQWTGFWFHHGYAARYKLAEPKSKAGVIREIQHSTHCSAEFRSKITLSAQLEPVRDLTITVNPQ